MKSTKTKNELKKKRPLFKNIISVSQKKTQSWRGKVCTYCSPCLSLSRPPMQRDHHRRLQLVETLHHSNIKKNPRKNNKNGWGKKRERSLYKHSISAAQKVEGKKDTYCSSWSSRFRRPMWRYHH
jgi:hypothetical protein